MNPSESEATQKPGSCKHDYEAEGYEMAKKFAAEAKARCHGADLYAMLVGAFLGRVGGIYHTRKQLRLWVKGIDRYLEEQRTEGNPTAVVA